MPSLLFVVLLMLWKERELPVLPPERAQPFPFGTASLQSMEIIIEGHSSAILATKIRQPSSSMIDSDCNLCAVAPRTEKKTLCISS